jgi:hypothetical protein
MTPRWTAMFLFSFESSHFHGARQFVVPADEIFDIFGGFWATVAPSYVICENPWQKLSIVAPYPKA